MKKLLILTLLIFTFGAGMVTASTFAPNGRFDGFSIVKVMSGGKELKPDKTPGILYKESTLVPVGLLRSIGVDVIWDAKKLIATIKLPPPRTVAVLIQSQLDELSKAVYKVTTAPTEGHPNGKQGTAFIFNGYAVTNAHVAGDADYAQVQIDGAWQKVSKYDFVDSDIDLMGFKVAGGKSLPISTELPQVGDPVFDISYSNGILTITDGEVNEIVPIFGIPHIKHSADTGPGGSGGILVNGRGEIIGVNESGMDVDGQSINYAIPISHVVNELK